ncbi:MAG TPA: hypothetical protein VG713_04585 [Pirellulales bacterium]|nr:hypothetical protein [Pirellulales bacterium]
MPRCQPCGNSAAAGCSRWIEELLPAIPRGTMPWSASDEPAPPPRPEHHYYALQPQQCQCMAASATPMASSIVRERDAATSRHDHQAAASLRWQVLTGVAAELQNKSSGAAMQLYYSLAEGEAKRDVLDRSMVELNGMLAKIDQMRHQGLQIPFDASEFERRKIEVASQVEDLELALTQGNHELRRLLGLETRQVGARFWPATSLSAQYVPLDVEAEVQVGLAQRPELNTLRRLVSALNGQTIDLVRDYLRSVNGLLAAESSGCKSKIVRCLLPSILAREIAQRRGQLTDMLARREREIAEEIREAVETYNTRMRQVALALERAKTWDHRLADLEKLQKTGGSNFAEIAVARLSRLAADGQTIEAIAAVEKSLFQLRELQGLLVAECVGQGNCPWIDTESLSEPISAPTPADVELTTVKEPAGYDRLAAPMTEEPADRPSTDGARVAIVRRVQFDGPMLR